MPRYDVPNAAPEPLRVVQQFLNTVDLENGHEWLAVPADLARWLREHGFSVAATVSGSDLRRALAVREALRALARANAGDPIPSAAVTTLEDASHAANFTLAVDQHDRVSLKASASGVDGVLGSLLALVVQASFDGTWARLKSCSHCRWAYYDRSRNRSARWCSMELCGNRAKTRAYRRRRSEGGAPQS